MARTARPPSGTSAARHGEPYSTAPVARRDGRGDRMRAVRPRVRAAGPFPARLLPALQGQGRQKGRQGTDRRVRGVRQAVLHDGRQSPLLLRSVPFRGPAQIQPRVHAAVRGRPPEARHLRGAHKGVRGRPQGQGKGREGGAGAGAPAAAGRIRSRTSASRRAVRHGRMRAVRPRVRAVRPYGPFLLQAMHGKGRQGDRQGAARGLQGVRQGVLDDQSNRPLLLGCMPRSGQGSRQAREQPRAHGRPREAHPGGGAHQGEKGRPRRRRTRVMRAPARLGMPLPQEPASGPHLPIL